MNFLKRFSKKLSENKQSNAEEKKFRPLPMVDENQTSQCCSSNRLNKQVDRRSFLGGITAGLMVGAGMLSCGPLSDKKQRENNSLKFDEFFKKNFRVMTQKEKEETIDRLERLHQLKNDQKVTISAQSEQKGVLFGYAFNISKCRGYMDCVKACVQENNLDRQSNMEYIKIFENKKGSMTLESANSKYFHEVPAEGHFYIGTQCFHCENPPCVDVCPVKATWKEPDGIVVVDYDWCVGCRYCEAACPYFGRRFNFNKPVVPKEEINKNQHYLGNRLRKKGVVEKCTFCIQRSRAGKNPACVEACPTGARIFGNLLDPKSEIRWVLANKKVFRLKEELGTEPKFWYFMD